MLSCRQAAELASVGMDRPLRWRERFGLAMHKTMCRACRSYERQLMLIRAASARLGQHVPRGLRLSAEARQRILERLRDRQ